MNVSATGFQAYAGFQSSAGTPAVAANGLGSAGAVNTRAAEESRETLQEPPAVEAQESRKNSGYTTPTRGSNLNIVV